MKQSYQSIVSHKWMSTKQKITACGLLVHLTNAAKHMKQSYQSIVSHKWMSTKQKNNSMRSPRSFNKRRKTHEIKLSIDCITQMNVIETKNNSMPSPCSFNKRHETHETKHDRHASSILGFKECWEECIIWLYHTNECQRNKKTQHTVSLFI